MPSINLEYNRQWRKDHPDKIKEIARRYREKHLEKLREYKRQYRKDHPDKEREYASRYRKKHREEINKRQLSRYYKHRDEIIMECRRQQDTSWRVDYAFRKCAERYMLDPSDNDYPDVIIEIRLRKERGYYE